MRHILELLFALILVLLIIGLAAGGEAGQGDTTRTEFSVNRTSDGGMEFYAGPPGSKPSDPFAAPGGVPQTASNYQPCTQAQHGKLTADGRWLCIEDGHNPGSFRWRPWPER
jgi:hypothetical protein